MHKFLPWVPSYFSFRTDTQMDKDSHSKCQSPFIGDILCASLCCSWMLITTLTSRCGLWNGREAEPEKVWWSVRLALLCSAVHHTLLLCCCCFLKALAATTLLSNEKVWWSVSCTLLCLLLTLCCSALLFLKHYFWFSKALAATTLLCDVTWFCQCFLSVILLSNVAGVTA